MSDPGRRAGLARGAAGGAGAGAGAGDGAGAGAGDGAGDGARAGRTHRRTRIQEENRERILAAALDVFASDGFRGATVDAIAEGAGMSKPNLLYYFSGKEEIYRTLLSGLLEVWLEPLEQLDPAGEPLAEITTYVRRKLEMSAAYPRESRLFAGEMLRGAPVLGPVLGGRLRALVAQKAAVIEGWIAAGRLAPHDPRHLIFAIWATTQHYADFDVQVRSVLGAEPEDGGHLEEAGAFLGALFLRGLAPERA